MDADNARAACPHCKQQLSVGAVICVNCGYDLLTGTMIQRGSRPKKTVDCPSGSAESFPDNVYYLRKRLFSSTVDVFDSRKVQVLHVEHHRHGFFRKVSEVRFFRARDAEPYIEVYENPRVLFEKQRRFRLKNEDISIGGVSVDWKSSGILASPFNSTFTHVFLSFNTRASAQYERERQAPGCLVSSVILAPILAPIALTVLLLHILFGMIEVTLFFEDRTPVATLGKRFGRCLLRRHVNGGDMEVCLIVSALTLLGVLPPGLPYQLNNRALSPQPSGVEPTAHSLSAPDRSGITGPLIAVGGVAMLVLAAIYFSMVPDNNATTGQVESKSSSELSDAQPDDLSSLTQEETTSLAERETLRPDGADQGQLHDGQSQSPQEPEKEPVYRTYLDSSGKHSTEAIFIDFRDGKVHLKKRDGSETAVPIEKLSAADQEYVRGRARN